MLRSARLCKHYCNDSLISAQAVFITGSAIAGSFAIADVEAALPESVTYQPFSHSRHGAELFHF